MALNACVARDPSVGSTSNGSRFGGPGHGPRNGALPSGTVTFAFTDIEASTDLVRRLGERYAELLHVHRGIVRSDFFAANGTEIDRQGDAFFFAFARACDAVSAAVEVQRRHALATWPDDVTVRLRIGLHTGEPTVGEERYLGIDVVLAARICQLAHGGDVLLSETTQALARSTLPEGVSTVPVGERHLKDIDEPVSVWRLTIDDIDQAEGKTAQAPHLPILAAREAEVGRRLGEIRARVLAGIGGRVASSLEAIPGSKGTDAWWSTLTDESLDDLAARAVVSLEDILRAGAVGALRAAHLAPNDL
jgi:class 3 adenylate cyclase